MKRKEGWKDGRIKERMNEKNKIFNAMMIERMNECWPEPPSPTPASMCPVQSRNPLHPGVHYPEASLRKLNPFGTTEKKIIICYINFINSNIKVRNFQQICLVFNLKREKHFWLYNVHTTSTLKTGSTQKKIKPTSNQEFYFDKDLTHQFITQNNYKGE